MTNPLRIGILGCAKINQVAIIDAARQVPEIALAGIASRDAAKAEAYAREHGIAHAYESYEALIADPTIEAIYNPLPNSMHLEWTSRALEAGKPVLCEKPIAANALEALEMAAAAKKAGLPLVEAFHYRYHPVAQRLTDIVRSGVLGKLEHIEAGFTIPGDRLKSDNIRFQRRLGGGATMDVGSYCINILRLASGEEPHVVKAKADLVAPDVDRAMNVEFVFPGGYSGNLQCSLAHDEYKSWLTVRGQKGKLHIDGPFMPQRGHSLALTIGERTSAEILDITPTYVFQAREFVKVVREGLPIRTTVEDGVANMRVIDAVYRAAGMSPRGSERN
ncbi:MAG: Gfo/Idh/MocA family oxidoreductase [Parvibaculum sp.]|uniref:Gfo/Idh/MocA family protein n=1 Tax=Parvibaculum sp. TaxID=2024848 RepID=UPI003C760DF8